MWQLPINKGFTRIQDFPLGAETAHQTRLPQQSFDDDVFVRKGTVGDWSDRFTAADLNFFDRVEGKTMARLRYECHCLNQVSRISRFHNR